MLTLANGVARAAHLFVFALAPNWLSPDPRAAETTAEGAVAGIALAALVAAAVYLARRDRSVFAVGGAALVVVAVVAAMAGAFTAGDAPIATRAAFVALPAWAGLAACAAAAAERGLGQGWKHKRLLAGGSVAAIGIVSMVFAAPLLGSTESMWWKALRLDPEHERALGALAGPHVATHEPKGMRDIADRCLAMHAGACACRELRTVASIRLQDPVGALQDAQVAVERCPKRARAHVALAEALAASGRPDAAEGEARHALELGGAEARARYALALALDGTKRHKEAIDEACRAVDAGGDRDARLLAGALLIVAGDLPRADTMLRPLGMRDPNDAEVAYNLALIADRRGDYNAARQGYLAALRADPAFANARYNVALLALRAGARDEARHHAKKFVEQWPEDPRGIQLLTSVLQR